MSEVSTGNLDVVPPRRSGSIARHTLLKTVVSNPKKMYVIRSPAGYGKTVLLNQIYDTVESTAIWINIRGKDKDPVVFLQKLDRSLAQIGDGVAKRSHLQVFDGIVPPSLSLWFVSILDEMNRIPNLHIFIDDCDLLNESESNSLLGDFLRDSLESVRFYVTTITDIEFKHSHLLMDSQLGTINQSDLVFKINDIEALFQFNDGAAPDREFVEKVETLTEGWPVAANYFSKNVNNEPLLDDFVKRFKYEKGEFDRYFLENVFENQSDFTKLLILKLSLLERFNMDLCLLLSDDEAEARNFFLNLKGSIFISSDDGSNYWFRFHRLFLFFLKKKSKEVLSDFQRKQKLMDAARWFMDKDFIDEAIDLAFLANELSQAAVWMEYAFTHIVLKNGQHDVFLAWFDRLPEDVLSSHPVARVGAIWSSSLIRKTMRAMEQIIILEKSKNNYCIEIQEKITRTIGLSICADKALKDEVSEVSNEIDKWIDKWADLSHFNNPNEFHFELGIAYLVKGYCKKCMSDFDEAKRSLMQSQKHFLARENFYGLTWSKSMLAVSYAKQGFHYEALQEAMSGYTYAKEKLGDRSHLGFGLAALIAAINYEYDELEISKVYIVDVIDYLKEQGSTDLLIAGFEIKSRLLFNDGLENEAIGFLKDSIRWSEENALTRLMLRMVDELVLSLFRLGRPLEAERYLSQYNLIIQGFDGFDISSDIHKITARCIVWFFIDKGQYDEAIQILTLLIDRSGSLCQQRRSAEWYKILAISHYRNKNNRLALIALGESIDIGVSQCYIRMYIDDADALLPILQLFVKGGHENRRIGFVEKIIKKIPKNDISDTLLEKLTAKEIEIVTLLQQGMPNRKIAEILGVSEGTLKWHLHNVYTKFMVKNRVQALLKAKEYGYL